MKAAAPAAAPGAIAQVIDKVSKEYNRTLTKKLLMIDALLLYCVATGIVQVCKYDKMILDMLHVFIYSYLILRIY